MATRQLQFRTVVAIGLALVLPWAVVASPMAAQAKVVQNGSTAIPPMGLGPALTFFAQQTGIQVVYVSQVVAGATTRGAPGGLSPQATLAALLKGTGLHYRFVNASTVTIYRDLPPVTSNGPAEAPPEQEAPSHRQAESALMAPSTQISTPEENMPDEIIVTAQRRSERLQDVPVAITSITAARLEQAGITNLRDIIDVTPGLHVSGAGIGIAPTIRGIGSQNNDPGNDANVAIYIDNVYQANQFANGIDLPDVSRIEVLKGPQGTLFGRNATGGAIRIFTREPSMDRFSGSVDLSYGNYNNVAVKAFVTSPLIDGKLAGSLSVSYHRMDGFDYDVVTHTKDAASEDRSLRLKLLGKPSDNTSIELLGVYTYRTDSNNAAWTALNGNSAARPAPGNPLGTPGAIITSVPHTYAFVVQPVLKSEVNTIGLHATIDTGPGQFSSMSTYNSTRTFYNGQVDPSSANLDWDPIRENEYEESEELLFTSNKLGQFQFTAGGFYYGSTGLENPIVLEGVVYGPYAPFYGFMRQRTDALSGFGELTWTPTDRLTFIAGGRYSHEKREAEGAYGLASVRPSPLPPIGPGHVSYSSFTPRASVRYRLTDEDDNLYFTYSQGFKSGIFNITALQPAPVKPEKVVAYEVGVKSSPSRMISANASAFFYDYMDQQVSQDVNGLNVTTNAARSHIYGADADITGHFTRELSAVTGISFLHARYLSFPDTIINAPLNGPSCRCGNITLTGVDLSGTPPNYSPDFTLSIGADYKKELAMGVLDFSANYYYTSRFHFGPGPTYVQPHYATLALRASFQPSNSDFSFYVWGTNVTSALYYVGSQISNVGDGVAYAAPATYGVGVKYNY